MTPSDRALSKNRLLLLEGVRPFTLDGDVELEAPPDGAPLVLAQREKGLLVESATSDLREALVTEPVGKAGWAVSGNELVVPARHLLGPFRSAELLADLPELEMLRAFTGGHPAAGIDEELVQTGVTAGVERYRGWGGIGR